MDPNNQKPHIPQQPVQQDNNLGIQSSHLQQSRKKFFIVGIIILALLLVAGSGFAAYQYVKSPHTRQKENKLTSSVLPTNPATPTLASTHNVNTYRESSDFQQYLSNNCKNNKNTVTISIDFLPIVVNTKKVQLINDDSRGKIICWMGGDDNGNLVSYLQVPYTDDNQIIKTYTIYDQYSKEVGHGGSPAIGNLGVTILDHNNITLSIYVPNGESGAAIGYTPVFIRGVRLLQTKSGQPWYVSTSIMAIKEDDPKLISLLKQYGQDVGGCPAAGCGWEVTDFSGAEKAVAKEFFGDMNHLSPDVSSAVEQIETNLQLISSRI